MKILMYSALITCFLSMGLLISCDKEDDTPIRLFSTSCPVPELDSINTYTSQEVTFDTVDSIDLLATIYTPDTPGPHAAIIFVHGGGWVIGDRSFMVGFSEYWAERGFVIMNMEYRLIGEEASVYPDMAQDVAVSVRYLRNNADNYSVDPDCIGIGGTSAGGHLAALIAYIPNQPEFYRDCAQCGDATAEVRFCITYYGIYDLANDPYYYMLTEKFIAEPYTTETASPINYVDQSNVHMWFSHGEEDDVVDITQAYWLRDEFIEHNKPYTFIPLPDVNHSFIKGDTITDAAMQTFPSLIKFLRRALTY